MDAVNASTDSAVAALNLPPQSFLFVFFKTILTA
jgi:hypothetical protein